MKIFLLPSPPEQILGVPGHFTTTLWELLPTVSCFSGKKVYNQVRTGKGREEVLGAFSEPPNETQGWLAQLAA